MVNLTFPDDPQFFEDAFKFLQPRIWLAVKRPVLPHHVRGGTCHYTPGFPQAVCVCSLLIPSWAVVLPPAYTRMEQLCINVMPWHLGTNQLTKFSFLSWLYLTRLSKRVCTQRSSLGWGPWATEVALMVFLVSIIRTVVLRNDQFLRNLNELFPAIKRSPELLVRTAQTAQST